MFVKCEEHVVGKRLQVFHPWEDSDISRKKVGGGRRKSISGFRSVDVIDDSMKLTAEAGTEQAMKEWPL